MEEAPETESQERAARLLASSPSLDLLLPQRRIHLRTLRATLLLRLLPGARWRSMWPLRPGGLLSAITQRYTLEPERLKRLNKLDGADPGLHPGQWLTVCEALQPGTSFMPKLW